MAKLTEQKISGVPILYQLLGLCLVMVVIVACGITFYLAPIFERELLNKEKNHIRDLVESTHSLMYNYYERYQNGEFGEKEAKKRAISSLRQMRYGTTGYFWVNDMKWTMIIHPVQPKLNGQDMFDYKDSSRRFIFKEFVKVCERDGQGYVNYK